MNSNPMNSNDSTTQCLESLRDALVECEEKHGPLIAFTALGIIVACVLESRDGTLIATAIQVAREKILAQKD